MALPTVDETYEEQTPEQREQGYKSPTVYKPMFTAGLPLMRMRLGENVIKLIPLPVSAGENPYVYVKRVHMLNKEMQLCVDDCGRDASNEMPCARAYGIFKDIKPMRPTYKQEREKRTGLMSDEQMADFAAKDALAKALIYRDWHFYLGMLVPLTKKGELPMAPECYGDYANRNEGRIDPQCAECPWAASCATGLSIFNCHYSDDKSTGKKMTSYWDKPSEPGRRKALFNVRVEGGVCKTKLLTVTKSRQSPDKGGKKEYTNYSVDGTDREFDIPLHVFQVLDKQLADRSMKDLIDDHISVGSKELLRLSTLQADFPFGKGAGDSSTPQPQSAVATVDLSDSPSASPIKPTTSSPRSSVLTDQDKTTKAAASEEVLEGNIEALINDPEKITWKYNPEIREKVPVCEGHYNSDWSKCSPERPLGQRCTVILPCRQQTTKAAQSPQEPVPAPVAAPEAPQAAPEPASAPEASQSDGGWAQLELPKVSAQEYAAQNSIKLPPCFGKPSVFAPGKANLCLRCEEKHAMVVAYCAVQVEAAKAFA